MNLTKSLIFSTAFFSLTTIGSANVVLPTSTTGTFDVTGVFTDKATLSGYFDMSNGKVISADITVSTVKETFTLDENDGGSLAAPGVWALNLNNDDVKLTLDLVLTNGATNLTNYNGGELCNTSGNCGQIVSSYGPAFQGNDHDNDGDDHSGAQLSGGSVAPEPGSTMLLGAGISALGLIFRKRFAKK